MKLLAHKEVGVDIQAISIQETEIAVTNLKTSSQSYL